MYTRINIRNAYAYMYTDKLPKKMQIFRAEMRRSLIEGECLPGVHLAHARRAIKTEYWDRAGGGGNISYDW